MTASVSDRLAHAARQVVALERPPCSLSPEARAFEMRRIAVLLDGCAEEARDLELRRVAPSRREQEGWCGPVLDRLAEFIGSFWPGTTAQRQRQGAILMLRAMRSLTGAMVDAGAQELAPYAATSTEIGRAMAQARDTWTAMVDQALRVGETTP